MNAMLLNDIDKLKMGDLWYDNGVGWRPISDEWIGKTIKQLDKDTVFISYIIRKESEETT